jgi:protein-ribulosamine 3-kinase
MDLPALAHELGALTGLPVAPQPQTRLKGGSLSQCFAWEAGRQRLFVKVAAAEGLPALDAEAQGLAELSATHAVRVPRVLARGTAGAAAFLALEWIESGAADARCEARLGAGLAALHGHRAARCGYGQDNFIGATPQDNGWMADWPDFFRERRLRPQLALAAQRGFAAEVGCGERLCRRCSPGARCARVSCTEISGAATGWRPRAGSRCSSTRPFTTAMRRQIWR